MSDVTLALLITAIVFFALLAWVPLLHQAETLSLRYARQLEDEMPDLREDDCSPHLWREAA